MYELPKELPVKPQPKLGEKLGNGSYKSAYANPDDPKLVFLCGNSPDEHRREIESLNTLEKYGIPVLPIHDVYQTKNYRTVIVADRCLVGSKAARYGLPKEVIGVLGGNTIRTGNTIIKTCREHGIMIGDFQFLVTTDGSLVVADPQVVWINQDKQAAVVEVRGWLDQYIQGAHLMKAIAAGKSRLKPTTATIFQLGKNFWEEHRQKMEEDEERAMAILGIYTQKVRRVWKKK